MTKGIDYGSMRYRDWVTDQLAKLYPPLINHPGTHSAEYTSGPLLVVDFVANDHTIYGILHPAYLAGHRVYIVEVRHTPADVEQHVQHSGQDAIHWGPEPYGKAELDGVPLFTRACTWHNPSAEIPPTSNPEAIQLWLRYDGTWIDPSNMQPMTPQLIGGKQNG